MTAIILIVLADSGTSWIFSLVVSDLTLFLKEFGIQTHTHTKPKPQALYSFSPNVVLGHTHKKEFKRKVNQMLISLTNFVVPFGNLQGLDFVSYLETNTNISQIFCSGK